MVTQESVIKLHGTGKRYGSHWALAPTDLLIAQGEAVALFGPNGSGKSTLLQIIATLLHPTVGTIHHFNNQYGDDQQQIRRQICFLGHQKQLYPDLTVEETLQLSARLLGLNQRESNEQIQTSLERLQLDKESRQRITTLSEGMKKRVVLARLLLGDFSLICLDEPHPTLDHEGREILNDLIQKWRQSGKTLLIASHDHEQVREQVDRILQIDQGCLIGEKIT